MIDSYGTLQETQKEYSPAVTDLYGSARGNFIKKVYSILLLQVISTLSLILLSIFNNSFFLFQIHNMWLFFTAIAICIIVEIYVFCCNGARTSPSNAISIAVFTLAESYVVSFIAAITGGQSGNVVVLQAGIYTLGIVLACTAYACYTDSDFTAQTGLMIVLSVVLMILGITTMFTNSRFMENLYCAVGVLVFGVYLIVDTQMIMGGHSVELSVDDYCVAALMLYIDIVQVFLYLLRLLSNAQEGQ